MRSLKFPKMFNTNNTRVWTNDKHNEATKQNLSILLHCERGELFGDPYYGLMLKHYLFSNKSVILEDALIDIIYNQLALFMPQLKVNRNNISLTTDTSLGKVYVNFTAVNQIDFAINTYQLLLFQNNDND